jgi:hypothetical protein
MALGDPGVKVILLLIFFVWINGQISTKKYGKHDAATAPKIVGPGRAQSRAFTT